LVIQRNPYFQSKVKQILLYRIFVNETGEELIAHLGTHLPVKLAGGVSNKSFQ
jgi:hypothetical protein